MSAMPTRAPCRTSAAAVDLPIPRAAPVMATTRPSKLFGCFAMYLSSAKNWPAGQVRPIMPVWRRPARSLTLSKDLGHTPTPPRPLSPPFPCARLGSSLRVARLPSPVRGPEGLFQSRALGVRVGVRLDLAVVPQLRERLPAGRMALLDRLASGELRVELGAE